MLEPTNKIPKLFPNHQIRNIFLAGIVSSIADEVKLSMPKKALMRGPAHAMDIKISSCRNELRLPVNPYLLAMSKGMTASSTLPAAGINTKGIGMFFMAAIPIIPINIAGQSLIP